MGMTAAQMAVLRSHVGAADPPSDAVLNIAYDRLLSVEAVAAEVLRGRLAALVSGGPAVFSIAGQVSQDARSNIDELKAEIATLEATIGGVDDNPATGVFGTVQLVRLDPSR
jgi:hypothetical protein